MFRFPSCISTPACHLGAPSSMCQSLKVFVKQDAGFYCYLSLAVSSTLGVMSGRCSAHARQLRHVAITCGMRAVADAGSDAALNIFPMAFRGACHQRRCNFRTSRFCCCSVTFRNILKLLSMLKFHKMSGNNSGNHFGIFGLLSVDKLSSRNRSC